MLRSNGSSLVGLSFENRPPIGSDQSAMFGYSFNFDTGIDSQLAHVPRHPSSVQGQLRISRSGVLRNASTLMIDGWLGAIDLHVSS